jgi:dihydroorotase
MILLRGATVLDPSTEHQVRDIAIGEDGLVSEIPEQATQLDQVIDCTGSYVVPGLVDLHAHVDVTRFDAAVPADDAHLRRGVVAINDGGSVGADGFEVFLRDVVHSVRAHVTCYLNASADGIRFILAGEYGDSRVLRIDDAVAVARRYSDVVKGIKVRLGRLQTGNDPLPVLEAGLKMADKAGIPLMAHIGDTACSLAQILDRLRPGDIVTHCFHGKFGGILEHGRPSQAVRDARARGIVFDIGHGTTQLSYAVARAAIGSGFMPDTISSDLTHSNWNGPAFDLVTVMSKLVGLGMPLADAIRATSVTPAAVLRLDDYGKLAVGTPAHITVLRQKEDAETLSDGSGEPLSLRRFEPVFVVEGASMISSLPRRDELNDLDDPWQPTTLDAIEEARARTAADRETKSQRSEP